MIQHLMLEAGSRFKIWLPAGDGEIFGPHAFDHTIGQESPITHEGTPAALGRVIDAQVADDGSGVSITYEILGPG